MTIEKQNIEQDAHVEEIDLSSVQPAAPAGEMEELVLSINRCSKVVKAAVTSPSALSSSLVTETVKSDTDTAKPMKSPMRSARRRKRPRNIS